MEVWTVEGDGQEGWRGSCSMRCSLFNLEQKKKNKVFFLKGKEQILDFAIVIKYNCSIADLPDLLSMTKCTTTQE